MKDERQNLPSASSLHRIAACPGSHRMCAGLPDVPTPESDFGTRVHEFLAGRLKAEDLTPEQLDIAESCQAIEEKVVKQWRLRNAIPDNDALEVSRDAWRMWLKMDGVSAFSGVADVIYLWNRTALIIDFKALPGNHADSDDNLQLRSLSVLVVENWGARDSIDTCLIQPLKTHTPTVCHYDSQALNHARLELLSALHYASRPNAPLIAGDHCGFCLARFACPAVRKEVSQLASLTIHEAELTVSDAEMAALKGRCGAAKKMIAAIEAECFRRAEANPDTWRDLGYEIKEGAGRRAVDDVGTVSERLNAKGASWNDIAAACSITIGKVEDLARKATGSKGLALKKECDAILDGCVTVKTAKPSLKKIGSSEDDE